MLRLMTGIHTKNTDNSFGICLTPQSKLRRGSHLQCQTVTSIAAKKQILRLWLGGGTMPLDLYQQSSRCLNRPVSTGAAPTENPASGL